MTLPRIRVKPPQPAALDAAGEVAYLRTRLAGMEKALLEQEQRLAVLQAKAALDEARIVGIEQALQKKGVLQGLNG